MEDTLAKLEAHLDRTAQPGPVAPTELPRLLAWAMHLTGAGYGYLRAGDLDLHAPNPLHTSVPAVPWPGVSVPQRAAWLFAAHSAGGPLVSPSFPPLAAATPAGPGGPAPLEDFLRRGGGPAVPFASPGTFVAVPLAGFDRYSGVMLDGQGNRYGDQTCALLQGLMRLATRFSAPWPDPDAFRDAPAESGGVPVLEWMGQHVHLTEPVTLGQDEAYALTVSDGLTSRRHLMVVPLISGQVMAIDLKSSNGTFVNGERIEQRLLKHGDVVHTAKRNWTLTFRRLPSVFDEPPRAADSNRAGFEAHGDRGGRLLDAVRSWRGEHAGRLPASLALELLACQYGLEELVLLTWENGPLRFVGARGSPRPGPLGSWRRRPLELLRQVKATNPVPVVAPDGGVLPLAGGRNTRALFTMAPGRRVDLVTLQATLENLVTGGETREGLRLFDEAALHTWTEAARATTSGLACCKALTQLAEAGFPVEARRLGEQLAARYLDGDELVALQADLGAFEG